MEAVTDCNQLEIIRKFRIYELLQKMQQLKGDSGRRKICVNHLVPVLKEWAYQNPRTFRPERKGLVSSGDSMAREAALLGVPAYYLGIRYTMPANAAASKVAGLQNRQTMPFERWIEGIEDKEKMNNPAADMDTAHAASSVIANQAAYEQAPRHLNCQSPSANTDESDLQDYSRKIVVSDNCEKSEKRSHADVLLARQQELREHIDKEFIDINQYMLNLVENVKKK